MNRNKLNIRMDLLRVAKTALDLKNPFDQKIASTFLDKAENEFAEKVILHRKRNLLWNRQLLELWKKLSVN